MATEHSADLDPAAWTHEAVLQDGTRVLVRPARAEDAALYPDFLEAVTLRDRRLRFFSAISEFSPTLLKRMTQVDPRRAMAFVALDAHGVMLGVVQLHYDPDQRGGEYAVLVRSDLKGRGLGWLLMQQIILYARHRHLQRIHGQVLAENTTMLQMCSELGFDVAIDPDDPDIRIVTLSLPGKDDPERASAA